MKKFYLKKNHFCDPEYAEEIVIRMGWMISEEMIDGDPFFVVEVPDNDIHLMEFIFDYFL